MIQIWPGNCHLHRLSENRVVIGPAFRWEAGDKVKIKDDVYTVEGHWEKLSPAAKLPVSFEKVAGKRNTHDVTKEIPGADVAGIRLVEQGGSAYLTDGLVVATRDDA